MYGHMDRMYFQARMSYSVDLESSHCLAADRTISAHNSGGILDRSYAFFIITVPPDLVAPRALSVAYLGDRSWWHLG